MSWLYIFWLCKNEILNNSQRKYKGNWSLIGVKKTDKELLILHPLSLLLPLSCLRANIETFDTVFSHDINLTLKFLKYSAARDIFNSFISVWTCLKHLVSCFITCINHYINFTHQWRKAMITCRIWTEEGTSCTRQFHWLIYAGHLPRIRAY